MHERKARMAELSDGFIAMPGGIGTFEEIFEIWTWAQLGIHQKPLGFLNVDGFYDALSAFLDATTSAGFLRPHHRAMALSHNAPGPLLDALAAFEPVHAVKWLDLKQS
ncbi:MAG: TIGR00730 family Rossman fold protein, partial [Bosea sp. (in: a-proteobacteria)]